MTINYTSLLGLAQPVTGTESGTWGTVVNDEITALLEQAVAGGTSINVTAGDVTLTDTDGQSNQARNAILLITGTPGTTRNIIAPSTSKVYIVRNGSDSSVVLKGAATTGVTLLAGTEALCFWNGSDFEIVSMIGPSSSTDNAIVRFDGTTGKVVQNSGVTIDDSSNLSAGGTVSGTKLIPTGGAVTGNGMYLPAANAVSITTNGADRVYIDSSGRVGIGTTAPDVALQVAGTIYAAPNKTTGAVLILSADAAGANGAEIETSYYGGSYGPMKFKTGGSERMRIDSSGNVGIGTSSPSYKLNVYSATDDAIVGFDSANASGPHLRFLNSGTAKSFIGQAPGFLTSGTTADDLGIRSASSIVFGTNGNNVRMRIDSSGNVGIGVTPSAWRSTSRTLQLGSGGFIEGRSDNAAVTEVGANAYLDSTGTWKYIGTGTSSLYTQAGGHFWYNAASGTAGNTITFTQAMTLDASGNLGIGTSSPGAKLDVSYGGYQNSLGAIAIGADVGANTSRTNATRKYGVISGVHYTNAQSNVLGIYIDSDGTNNYIGYGGGPSGFNAATIHQWFTAANNTTTAGTERMRIDSSGNVGIGTSSPGYKLEVSNAGTLYVATTNSSAGFTSAVGATSLGALWSNTSTTLPTLFYTNGTERMRIDSSGNVGIGVTPSAWVSYKSIDMIGNGGFSGYTGETNVSLNAYYSSGWKYKTTSTATLYTQYGGAHYLYSAASGTAGNAITFTQVLAVEKAKTLALEGATSQTGTGITFPATQSASTNANTLDDYEEGTWTPVIEGSSSSGTASYTKQLGKYTKIGNVVYFGCDVKWTSGTGTGNLIISGLPFQVAATYYTGANCVYFETLTVPSGEIPSPIPEIGNSYMTVYTITTSGGTSGVLAYDAAARMAIYGFYFV